MLVNNLKKHREKYSKQHYEYSESVKSKSVSKQNKSQCKIEREEERNIDLINQKNSLLKYKMKLDGEHNRKQTNHNFNSIRFKSIESDCYSTRNRKLYQPYQTLETQDSRPGTQKKFYPRNKLEKRSNRNIFLNQYHPCTDNLKNLKKISSNSKIEPFLGVKQLTRKDFGDNHRKNQRVSENLTEIHVEKTDEEEKMKAKEKDEQIIQSLKFNEVFFCANCFRYSFAIERHYHFPNCNNALQIEGLAPLQKYQVGLEKLNLLIQLSVYTKQKTFQIQQIHNKLTCIKKNPSACKQVVLRYPELKKLGLRRYYELAEIETAAYLIISKLMLSYLMIVKDQVLCNNIRCDDLNQI